MSNINSLIVVSLVLAVIFVPQFLALYLDAERNSESV